MLRKKNKRPTKKIIIIVILIILALAAATVGLKVAKIGPFSDQKIGKDGINYSPPTKEEKEATEEHKRNLAEKDENQDEQPEESSDGKKQVKPFITVAQQFQDEQYGDRVEVHAYISEIIESGGKCTATFTKDGQKVTSEVEGLPNVSTTNCDTIMVARDKFLSGGIWSLVISYQSGTAQGTSDAMEVEVK